MIVCAAYAVLLSRPGRAENWPQWRGPFFNGSTTETNLPEKFSPTENVVWTADVPAAGGQLFLRAGTRLYCIEKKG